MYTLRDRFLARMLLPVLTGAAALAAAPPVVQAAPTTFVVNSFLDTVDAAPGNGACADSLGQCSLRAAIMESNALSDPNTVILPPGVYTLALAGRDENAGATGDLDILHAMEIIGAGGNAEGDPSQTIIQAGNYAGGGIDKVFSVNPNWDTPFATSFKALTIRYGQNTSSRSGDGFGGGLDWEASGTGSLTIYNCIISDNSVADGDGGGLALTNGPGGTAAQVIIEKTTVANNSASAGVGGGIFFGSDVPFAIRNAKISANRSQAGGPSSTGQGGGIFAFSNSPGAPVSTIDETWIADNQAQGPGADGGGIFAGRPLQIRNSAFSGNASGRDGGAFLSSLGPTDQQTLANVTLSANAAAQSGGGYLQSGSPAAAVTLTNLTVTQNQAPNGAGIHHRPGAAPVRLFNSIVTDGIGGMLDAASAFNLIGTGPAGGLTGGVNGNHVGVADMRLSPLGYHGGTTPTHALLAGSPALDAGSAAYVSTATDQRGSGFARAADGPDADTTATVDIGAYEAHPSLELLADQTMPAGGSLTLTFNVGDAALGIGTVYASSSNAALVPGDAAHLLPGPGPTASTRSLTITPAAGQFGTTIITVSVGENGVEMSDDFVLTVVPAPDLTLTKSHPGNFEQGQTGAQYTVSVTNIGTGATAGPVVVTDALPPGLTATAMTGAGWTCDAAALACDRSDPLAPGESYPPITLMVDVAMDAPPSMTNTASVAGGGDSNAANNTASDPTVVNPAVPVNPADLTVSGSHNGNIVLNQRDGAFTLVVRNVGAGPTVGIVTVTDLLPPGVIVVSMTGAGWTCDPGTATCTRADELAPGASYAPITLVVAAAANAPFNTVNQVTVQGGGDQNPANNTHSDPVKIVTPPGQKKKP